MASLRTLLWQDMKSLGTKAVHIKVEPQPRSVYEGRHILRLLQQYGKVSWFQNLRHDPVDPAPHTTLVIFESSEAVSKLLAASPLDLQIRARPPFGPVAGPVAMGIPRLLEMNKRLEHQKAGFPLDSEEDKISTFQVKALRSTNDHRARMTHSKYYWGYRPKQGALQMALKELTPTEGMSNLPTDSRRLPSRLVTKMRDSVNKQRLSQHLSDRFSQEPSLSN